MTFKITSGTSSYTLPRDPFSWSIAIRPKYSVSSTIGGQVVQLLGNTRSGSFSFSLISGLVSKQQRNDIFYGFASFYANLMQNQRDGIPSRISYSEEGADIECALGDINRSESIDTVDLKLSINFDETKDSTPTSRADLSDLFNMIKEDIGFTEGVDGWHGGSGTDPTQPIVGLTKNGVEVTSTNTSSTGTSANLEGTDVQSVQKYAHAKVLAMGWTEADFAALVKLWNGESGWNYKAENASSGAYGIPQSLPGSKMGTSGSDWKTNPATQIDWGLNYIKGRYGSPSQAWAFWQSKSPHWY
jgi:hypothetical protein